MKTNVFKPGQYYKVQPADSYHGKHQETGNYIRIETLFSHHSTPMVMYTNLTKTTRGSFRLHGRFSTLLLQVDEIEVILCDK